MTFEKWAKDHRVTKKNDLAYKMAKSAWQAATAACKQDCRSVQQAHAGMVHPYHLIADECITAINKRENSISELELT